MSKSLLSLGDLLTALNSVREDERPALARAFGMSYASLPRPEPKRKKKQKEKTPPAEAKPIQPPTLSQPPTAMSPVFWRVAEAYRPAPARPAMPAWLATQPLPDAAFYLPAAQARPPGAAPLVARARFARFMREQLTVQRRSGKPDLQCMTQVLAHRRALRHLPQQTLQRWPALVRVLVDGASALRPFQHDVTLLLGQMRRQLGPRLQVHAIEAEPLLGSGAEAAPLPADATPTLVFSGAGVLGADAALARRWAQTAQRLQRGGRAPVLLSPLDPSVTASAMDEAISPQGFWFDGRGRIRRTTTLGTTARVQAANVQKTAASAAAPEGTGLSDTLDASQSLGDSARRLRATLWGNCYVTPSLLRALRLLLQQQGAGGVSGGGLADELAVWQDQSVVSNAQACAVRPEYRRVVEDDFRQLPPAVQSQAVALHLDHLAHQSPLVRAEYALHLGRVALDDAAVAQRLGQERAAAELLAAQAAAWLARGDLSAVQQDLAAFLARLGSRSGELLAGSETLRAAWALAQQDALRAGELDLPAGLDLQQVAWVLQEDDDLPLTHQLRLQAGPGYDGRPSVQAVFEAAPPQPTGSAPAAVPLGLLPAVPFLTLAPDGDSDSLRLLITVLSWLLPLQQAGRLKGLRPVPGQAWARPFLDHLVKLMRQFPGDAERLALEWLGSCRHLLFRAEPQVQRSLEKDADLASECVHLLVVALPDDVMFSVLLRLPGSPRQRQHLRQGAAAALSSTWPTQVVAGPMQFQLDPFTRPPWAEEIQVEGALQVRARTAEGRWLRWMPRAPWKVVQGEGTEAYYTPPAGFWWDEDEAQGFLIRNDFQLLRPAWAARHGVDGFGYWAEFELAPPEHAREQASSPADWLGSFVRQRMRFIPPGQYWVGAPLSEDGRTADEALRRIMLTSGCWLADTACTQRLWNRVMDRLPDGQLQFMDDLPVVNVSHDDIQENFLPALALLAPGLAARLPTEAQWEVAARAGTITAYPWGDAPNREAMNFGGFEKQGWRRPLPVDFFNSNEWGLYQMHGNVWEWCADAVAGREVHDGAEADTDRDVRRSIRGGSWISDARRCRSACRMSLPSSGRNDGSVGFRLALGLAAGGTSGPGEAPAQASQTGPGDGEAGTRRATGAEGSTTPKAARRPAQTRVSRAQASRAATPTRRPTLKK